MIAKHCRQYVLLTSVFLAVAAACVASEDAATVERRLARAAQFLAADQMAGRGLGTPEIEQAADFIADQFADMGLDTSAAANSPFQVFSYTRQAQQGENNWARFVHRATASEIHLEPDEDFRPLALGGGGQVEVPLVFVGYGITAPEADYDDYAEVDVRGKAVIVMRHEPQQANPHSVFNGTDHSEHAPFRRKVKNATDHGAAAIIFCTDQFEIDRQRDEWKGNRDALLEKLQKEQTRFAEISQPTNEEIAKHRETVELYERQARRYERLIESDPDVLLPFEGAGPASSQVQVPVLFARRAAIDRLLAESGKPSLTVLEEHIDREVAPASFAVNDWRIVANVDVQREEIEIKNVVGVLEGVGPLADETIVIGAHYDHLGRGGMGSAEPGSSEIHNGADDNASGTVVLLEIARHFATRPGPPARRLVFIAFTGEERGLLGSAHYVNNPLFPLESTVAMINLDMVGRLNDNKLVVNGVDTAQQFSQWVDAVNERHGFDVNKVPGGMGPSDHASFYSKQVPVLHFFTGLHNEYHRPSDDVQLLNVTGMRRVGEFICDTIEIMLEQPGAPIYVETTGPSRPDAPTDPRPYFGSIPDFSQSGEGYAISGVGPGSPAADAGLEGGDRIVRLADIDVENLEDFDRALRKFTGGDKVPVVVVRDGEEITLEVVLAPPRG